ncbi:hypothetical protein LJK88_19390 [Paenibacillus sp. P26]|nr:hypothetical protein LJK88_19390 [Paenibacillus sp. P26]
MTDGCIDISPYRMGQATACMQCAFRPVCQFDPQFEGNDYKGLPSISKDKVWELMERKTGETPGGFRSLQNEMLEKGEKRI